MNDQQPQQQSGADRQASAARHALDDQQREEQRAQSTPKPQDTQQAGEADNGSALGAENDDIVSEASAESFPASDPPSTTRSSAS